MLHVVLVDASEHDGIHGTRFLAEAAVNALEQIDVVAAGPPRAIRRNFGIDRDTNRRTHRLAKLAGDTALLPIRIAAQGMQSAEPRRLRSLFLRVGQRVLGAEVIAPPDHHAPGELGQQHSLERIDDSHELTSASQCANRAPFAHGPTLYQANTISTPIQTIVTGINTFQPRRMIWS